MKTLDAVVIGGGIAGLWTLARLRQAGYAAILLERDGLGGGQTLASQGIIHGGSKYALHGRLSGAAQAIAAMPARWQQALSGRGEIDLRRAAVLSPQQYLWTGNHPGSKLTAFFAGKVMRSRMQRLQSPHYPAFLPQDFPGHCYALNEPVLDIAAVIACFVRQLGAYLHTDADWQRDGDLLSFGGEVLRPRYWIYTAGENNQPLSGAAGQIRPLRMTALRVPADAPAVYGHCLGMSEQPKITVTTHPMDWRQPQGDKIYWIGGAPAETGISRDDAAQTAVVRDLLRECLPSLGALFSEEKHYRHFPVMRAEGKNGGKRPDLPILNENGNELILWPTKLAFAPLAAEQILARLPPADGGDIPENTATPRIAPYPWQSAYREESAVQEPKNQT